MNAICENRHTNWIIDSDAILIKMLKLSHSSQFSTQFSNSSPDSSPLQVEASNTIPNSSPQFSPILSLKELN